MWSHPALHTVLCTVLEYYISAVIMGAVLLVSHNFNGAHQNSTSVAGPTHPGDLKHRSKAWIKDQVEASCNYSGELTGLLVGGMNYQIEHHLFPRISSMHYPVIAPIVRKYCQENGIRYVHHKSYVHAWLATFRHLRALGSPHGWQA